MKRAFALIALVTALSPVGAYAEEKDISAEVKDPGFYGERIPRLDFMDVYDPWERFNRGVYVFNGQFDRWVFLPALRVYHVIPKPVRTGIHNFWENINEVQNFTGSLLQLKAGKSVRSVGRFVVNTTLGIGGLFDVATKVGIKPVNEDFGQVLGYWGVAQGPYLVIPFLGPSNLRDGFGKVVDAGIAQAVNVFQVPEERSENPWVFIDYALDTRDSVNFRYGQLQSPFEYEMVRFAVSEARRIMVESDEPSSRAKSNALRQQELQQRDDAAARAEYRTDLESEEAKQKTQQQPKP